MRLAMISILLHAAFMHSSVVASPPVDYDLVQIADGEYVAMPMRPNDVLPAAEGRPYDNYRDPGAPELEDRGNTVLLSAFRVGENEVGDDLQLVDPGAAIVSDMGFTFVNMSPTDTATSFRFTHRFYDENLVLLGQFSARLGGSFPPNAGARFTTRGGVLTGFHIPVAERMFVTTTYSDIIGIDPNDVGVRYGGPVTIGSSTQFIRNFTTGQQIDLGDANQNLGYFINTIPIPAPAASITIAFAGLLATRRRRA
jgi:hypothetical protein